MTEKNRVLIVEDNPEQYELVSDYLRLDGQYELVWARDIQSLWDLIKQEKFDIILLDFMLPDGTGLDALIQFPYRNITTPVIMVTGQGDERIATQALQHGASDYIVKNPDYVQALPSAIRKVIKDSKLQKAFQESLEKNRYQALILNNVKDAVVVWNIDGRITFWNLAAEKLFGWRSIERVNQSVYECYWPLFEPVPEWNNGQAPFLGMDQDRQIKIPSGKTLWINSKITSLHADGKENEIIGYMDVARDITDRKQMEDDILRAQAQLLQSARLTAIGELASGIAHKIYNPLTGVIANSHLLMKEVSVNSAGMELAQDIQKAGWAAQKVVTQLLDFSKPVGHQHEEVDINQTVTKALELVDSKLHSVDIQVDLKLANELPTVTGNGRQIEDIWVNLLLLARDAIRDSGTHFIQVKTWEGKKDVWIQVFDDGNPIPLELMTKVFEPNFVSSEIGRGSGLELSICREIIRQHQGQIVVKSSSEGTAFQISIPISSHIKR